MNHARDNVFAGAALALNQDGNVGAGDLVHAVAQRLHNLRVAENHASGGNSPSEVASEVTEGIVVM